MDSSAAAAAVEAVGTEVVGEEARGARSGRKDEGWAAAADAARDSRESRASPRARSTEGYGADGGADRGADARAATADAGGRDIPRSECFAAAPPLARSAVYSPRGTYLGGMGAETAAAADDDDAVCPRRSAASANCAGDAERRSHSPSVNRSSGEGVASVVEVARVRAPARGRGSACTGGGRTLGASGSRMRYVSASAFMMGLILSISSMHLRTSASYARHRLACFWLLQSRAFPSSPPPGCSRP